MLLLKQKQPLEVVTMLLRVEIEMVENSSFVVVLKSRVCLSLKPSIWCHCPPTTASSLISCLPEHLCSDDNSEGTHHPSKPFFHQ